MDLSYFITFSAIRQVIFKYLNSFLHQKRGYPINILFDLHLGHRPGSECLFYLLKAVLANSFSVEKNDVVCICAEHAGGLIFLKDYSVFVGKYFKRILLVDIHSLSDADGEHNSSQLVDLSYYSG